MFVFPIRNSPSHDEVDRVIGMPITTVAIITKAINIVFIFLGERLRSPSRHLWRVVVERLVGPDFFIFRSEREGEGRKWAENAQNRPVRAVRGHFGPIFHHFSVLEPSRGHFCITFLLNWVPRSFPRRCVIPRAEFSFLRSNVSVLRTAHFVRRTEQRLVRLSFFLLVLRLRL